MATTDPAKQMAEEIRSLQSRIRDLVLSCRKPHPLKGIKKELASLLANSFYNAFLKEYFRNKFLSSWRPAE